MLVLLAFPVIYVVKVTYHYLGLYAPSNLLIRRVRTSAPRWRTGAALLALTAALLLSLHALQEAITSGAPGWLSLVVLILAWDAIKLGLLVGAVCGHALASIIRMRRSHPSLGAE